MPSSLVGFKINGVHVLLWHTKEELKEIWWNRDQQKLQN